MMCEKFLLTNSQNLSQQQQTHFRNVFFTCPMCRERVSSDDINYVRSDDFVDTSDSQLIVCFRYFKSPQCTKSIQAPKTSVHGSS